jgi:predicted amidophosphoribosyltransferase
MSQLKVLFSSSKRKLSSWISAIIDLFFPPLCHLCAAPTRRLLCSECFDLLAVNDIASRCRHCFALLETPSGLCRQCAHSPALSFPRAYLIEPSQIGRHFQSVLTREEEAPLRLAAASLLLVLWHRLNWPIPDRIILVRSMQHHRSLQEIGEEFAQLLDRPLSDEFSLRWISPFQWRLKRCNEDLLENQSILLLDFAGSASYLADALNELWPAFPGKIYILSVFGHD